MMFEKVISEVESLEEEFIQFVQGLIKTPSENPPGNESDVAEVIVRRAKKLGLPEPKVLAKKDNRPNLIFEIEGKGDGPTLMYNGHLDTKPVGVLEKWDNPPFGAIIKGNKLFGLGSSDMKGAVAAMLYAGAICQREKLKGNLKLIFSADEEAGGTYGAEYVAKNGNIKADICLIGEPCGVQRNWEKLHIIARGETCFKTKVYGTQMHSSISDLVPSVNASIKMAQLLVKMSSELKFNYPPHPLIPQGVTKGYGVMVKGGVYYGVLPGYAEFSTDIRLLPGMTPDDVKRDVLSFIEKAKKDDPELEVKIEFEPLPLGYIKPTEVSADEPFVRILRDISTKVLSFTPELGAFPAWTDARFFDEISGIKTIPAFGPGFLTITHSPKEYVEVKSLIEALKIYSLAAIHYLET